MRKNPDYKGPQMEEEDLSKTRSLFSQSLVEENFKNFPDTPTPTDERHIELINWFNSHLARKNSDWSINNFGSDIRSGVRLLQMLEVNYYYYFMIIIYYSIYFYLIFFNLNIIFLQIIK